MSNHRRVTEKDKKAQGLAWCAEHSDTNSPGGDIDIPKQSISCYQAKLLLNISQY